MDMNVGSLVRGIRVGNCIISAIGVMAGYALAGGVVEGAPRLAIAMLSAFAITGAGNLINDYFDLEIDKKSGKARMESRKLALAASIALFATGLVLAYALVPAAFWIAAIVSALLIIYSARMRPYKYLGNIVVAFGTAATLLFGAALVFGIPVVAPFAAAAFFANVAREIAKDAEDIKTDKGVKRTLPMMMGFMEMKKIIFLLYLGAIASGAFAYFVDSVSGTAFLALFAASIALFLNSFRLFSQKRFAESQRHSKYGMVAALAAFLGGMR